MLSRNAHRSSSRGSNILEQVPLPDRNSKSRAMAQDRRERGFSKGFRYVRRLSDSPSDSAGDMSRQKRRRRLPFVVVFPLDARPGRGRMTMRRTHFRRATMLCTSFLVSLWAACALPSPPREATPEEIRTFFQARNKTVLTFAGYSGAEYEDPAAMLQAGGPRPRPGGSENDDRERWRHGRGDRGRL